jgi:hypothetical protein
MMFTSFGPLGDIFINSLLIFIKFTQRFFLVVWSWRKNVLKFCCRKNIYAALDGRVIL